MDNNEQKLTTKKDNGSIRVAFSAMIAFVLFLGEIYLMIHGTEYFIGLVTVTVLLLADLYILVTSMIQLNYQKEQRLMDEIDDLFRSEKATYLLLRKNFNEINERLLYVEDNLKTPTEEIIAAQKAVAKVTISRNKENSDALMNSNDKLLERFFSFEDLLMTNNDKMLEQQKLILDQTSKEILLKQQESTSKLKELELSIKNEILQSVNTITSVQPKIVMAPQPSMPSQPQMSSEPSIQMQPDTSVPDVTEMITESPVTIEAEQEQLPISEIENLTIHNLDEEPGGMSINELLKDAEVSSIDDLLDNSLNIGVMDDSEASAFADEEPEIDLGAFADEEPEMDMSAFADEEPELDIAALTGGENIPMPDLSDPNKVMSPDDIAALLANVGGDEPVSEAVAEEPVIMEEPVVEEPVTEAPVEEEKPPMPDLSDPNKVMSPEDIAALLANVGGEEPVTEAVAEEPVIMEEPVIEAPVEEEKPPMPDLSDPNKIMSPEDIAALLANM